MSAHDRLPKNWICKKSRSHPNNFFYFNTKTKQSQWFKPCGESDVEKSAKTKSKIKKKYKTPAQDRLLRLIATNKTVADEIKDLHTGNTAVQLNKTQSHSNENPKRTQAKRLKLKQTSKIENNSNALPPVKSNITSETNSSQEIPRIFKKTPAQDRLNQLRHTFSPNVDINVSITNGNENLSVIKSAFGICDSSIESFNESYQDEDYRMDWESSDSTETNFGFLENMSFDNSNETTFIVPDTNVFVHSLQCIRALVEKAEKWCILVPFVVLQELDRLKSNSDQTRKAATFAIRFIYNQLKSNNGKIQGQKAMNDIRHLIEINNADDKILNCCIQLKNELRQVLLISNDINLSNKALASGIEAITSKECISKYNL